MKRSVAKLAAAVITLSVGGDVTGSWARAQRGTVVAAPSAVRSVII
jgi:hypothetical protein